MKQQGSTGVSEIQEDSGHFQLDWLGAEASVHILPHRQSAFQYIQSNWISKGKFLTVFISGLAMGGWLALFSAKPVATLWASGVITAENNVGSE
ncbi:hypothetical protein W02_33170 [Nitrospira sp. KM1]|uniref:hypothetical protein n=1 Tax=Nitrospira sp. KM1 TaxID=1936990 RepID=UPI0013A71AFC|nr:hypothetical protein [Nitrospira sp. KM1]BCA56177.1 hypothetical protein W02_33170 [Nitrospira sp. KM1]